VENGACYHLDEDGNKKYFVGHPIRGVTCNVHPASFPYLDDYIDPELFKKVVESFKEPPPPSGKELTNE
jgi:hypothetical protein